MILTTAAHLDGGQNLTTYNSYQQSEYDPNL